MIYKVLFTIYGLCFLSDVFSQTMVVHHQIQNNDTSIRLLTQSETKKSVIFFCPTATINEDFYFKKAEELNRSNKLKVLSDLTLYFIYFKQDTKNNSKGVKYVNSMNSDTMFIGQFECIFSGFDNKLLLRAKNKMKFNYDVVKIFDSENVWSVPIVDTNKCFEKMQDRIPFYGDFIRESCNPVYSTDEKMQFIRDTVITLNHAILNLQIQMDSLKAEFDRLKRNTSLDQENIINENSKKQDKKSGNTTDLKHSKEMKKEE